MIKIITGVWFTISYLLSGQALFAADIVCPSVKYGHAQYGPIDYYDPKSYIKGASGLAAEDSITVVTTYHLTPRVISLKKGQTSAQVYSDLDYTLRALPNHPVALDTVSRFENKRALFKTYARKQKPMPYPADCYFERAFRVFGKKQPETWMIWGIHKHRLGKYEQALENYEQAVNFGLDSADLHYYMGLTYYKLENYDLAKKHADLAYSKGYALPGLKRLLKKVAGNQ